MRPFIRVPGFNPRSVTKRFFHEGRLMKFRGFRECRDYEEVEALVRLAERSGVPIRSLWMRHRGAYLLMVAEGYEGYL